MTFSKYQHQKNIDNEQGQECEETAAYLLIRADCQQPPLVLRQAVSTQHDTRLLYARGLHHRHLGLFDWGDHVGWGVQAQAI